jgi:hypothetical protein
VNAESIAVRTAALSSGRHIIPYGGYVDFDGEPVNAGDVKFNFVLFPCATPGPGQCSHLWVAHGTWNDEVAWTAGWPAAASGAVTLPIFSGRFTVELGAADQNLLPVAILQEGYETLYLGIQIEGSALTSLQKLPPASRAVTASQADRFRVRNAIEIDDPAGGSAVLEADGGLVVAHSRDDLAPEATLLRVENGGVAQLAVTAGAGVTTASDLHVGGALEVGGALDVAGDVRVLGQLCDSKGCAQTEKVFWHAYNLAGVAYGGGQTLAYSATTVNEGGAYSTTSGIATIPVAGTYRLCTYSATPGAGSVAMRLYVNGMEMTQQGGYVWGHDGGYGNVNVAGCALRRLGQGDAVEWRSTGSLGVNPSGAVSYMNGELL